MATITSIQSGDWSDSTTWDGGIVPVSTDNIVVSAGHTVVMNVNFVTTGKISNNGTLTILNPLQIGLHGDGVTRRPGTLEVGPKSLINGHGSIYPCYGEMKSSPENQEWAKISVNILDLPDVPENQKAEIRYSFRFTAFSFFFGNNGISRFPCRGTGLFSFLNCTFSGFGNTSLRFGAGGGITLSETPIIFSGCDFRNCGDIFFITSDGTADVKKHFNKLTFFSDTRKTINFEARTDKTNVVSDSVFINYEQKSDGTDFPIKNINVFLGRTLDRWSVLTEKHKNSMLQSSYVYVPSDIFNGIGVEIATVSEGVFECQSSANPIMHRGHYVPHDVPFLTSGVLHLGYGAMAGILADESRSWKIENCTRISESVSSTNSLWLSQTGVLSNIENGLVARNCMQACLAGAPDTNTCRTSADAYLQE
ncbi:G8 domain-containing protein, partial [Desulfosarcina sp. OttesenSCG-928-B08]|nr:G8 domain-containing protein [Desulfosarcina sp. OttesenSCG-928-B08]